MPTSHEQSYSHAEPFPKTTGQDLEELHWEERSKQPKTIRHRTGSSRSNDNQNVKRNGDSRSQNSALHDGPHQAPFSKSAASLEHTTTTQSKKSGLEGVDSEEGTNARQGNKGHDTSQIYENWTEVRQGARLANGDNTEDLDYCAPDGDSYTQGPTSIRKLSSAKLYEVTSSPEFLPRRSSVADPEESVLHLSDREVGSASHGAHQRRAFGNGIGQMTRESNDQNTPEKPSNSELDNSDGEATCHQFSNLKAHSSRPHLASRTFSTPSLRRRSSSKAPGSARTPIHRSNRNTRSSPKPIQIHRLRNDNDMVETSFPSPMPSTVPAPPRSLSTYLELELSSKPPPPFYIHRSATNDLPYESSRVKLERLQNFLLLPPQLEQVLWFGALACLDAWLYSFTLLPLRFLKAIFLLFRSWAINFVREIKAVGSLRLGNFWRRRRKSSLISHTAAPISGNGDDSKEPQKIRKRPSFAFGNGDADQEEHQASQSHRTTNTYRHHRRTKSSPSTLSENHKADILKGLLILISSTILMYFDASRMYHGIRGQAAIKLYVIYNVLEVCDRLFSAIGQDVLECLLSKEALERKPDGRSKVLRPFWLFILALCYNLVHATALFYQVITLNVAVNSYSNALLTLLMSNQFVEIKSTVFKKFEKENLFQLTCADVVERFQLWLMLTIIAARNVIETGGLSLGNDSASDSAAPLQSSSILPRSFTLFPVWTGQIMGPFLLVLGSEMLVDWIKHAYITKFNLTKPAIYGRFLDVLAKDYYTNAFADQNLTRRLGLPVIPLSCLFIRASVQTYHMFLATHMPLPIPSTATSLSVDEATTSPATTAALQHIDHIFRRALGRSTFGGGGGGSPTLAPTTWLNTDDLIAFSTMVLFFLVLFLVLLALKLVLGMCLLSFARRRYIGMKQRERDSNVEAEGKRVGGWGVVEVDEAKRSWIYVDDREGLEKLRERDRRKGREDDSGFSGVSRYSMVAKRIW